MYKWNDESMLKARLPFVYTHYYCQFLKQTPRWYFEVYPNTDTEGKTKFQNHPDAGWVIYINKREVIALSPEHLQEITLFFEQLREHTGYPTVLLHEYAENEERL